MSARAIAPMALAILVASATAVLAQTAAPTAPAPQAPTPVAATPHKVAVDTLIVIEFAQPVSTAVQKRGDMFAIRLGQPIMLDGQVLVPAGIPGEGQVVDSGKSGLGGKPAKLVLAARYLDWNGQRLPLHGFSWARTGADRQTEAINLAMVPYAGMLSFLVRGGEIEIPVGTPAQAKLGTDILPPSPSPAPAAIAPTPNPQPNVQGSHR
jgi:hypothetical protein